MATKKGSSKKGGSKKGGSKKGAAKKGASKQSLVGVPVPNLACINACVKRFMTCMQQGGKPAKCMKELQDCIRRCVTGG